MKSLIAILMMIALSFGSLMAAETLNAKDSAELQAVFTSYEGLHAAFLNYNGANVEKSAIALRAAITKLSNPEISKALTITGIELSKMVAGNSQPSNNTILDSVSVKLSTLITKYSLSNYQAYYCPMEKKRWIQNKKMTEVKNPYLAEMESCGVKE